MANLPPSVPVSQELFELIFERLEQAKPSKKIIGMEKGPNPSEIIFKTAGGKVSCIVKETSTLIIFEMAAECLCMLKKDFLRQDIPSTRNSKPHPGLVDVLA